MIRFNCPNCGRHYELPDALANLPLVCKQCAQRLTPPAPSPEPPPPPPKPVAPPPAPTAAPAAPKPGAPKPAPVATPAPVGQPKTAPAPVAAPKPAPVATCSPPPAPVKTPAPPPTEPDDDDVLVAKPGESPDIDFNIGGPTAASLSEATRARPAGLADATRRSTPDLSNVFSGAGDSIPDLNLDLLPPAPPPPPPKPAAAPPPPEPPPEKPEPTTLPFLVDLGAFVLLVVGGLFLGEFLVRKPMGTVLSEAGAAPKFPPMDLLLLLGPPVMFGLIYLLLGSRERTLGAWIRRRRRSAP